jgi:hypothetical protein
MGQVRSAFPEECTKEVSLQIAEDGVEDYIGVGKACLKGLVLFGRVTVRREFRC